jgi:predicted transcriptional regulator
MVMAAGDGQDQRADGERISDAEHAVMEALWTRAPLTAAEVCEEVCGDRGWTLATVKTLLSRLVSKRAVTTEAHGRRFLYTPAILRSDYVGGESKRLVDRLFGGRAAPLFAQLAEAEALSERDLAEIETLLDELKRKGEAS